MRDLPLPFVGVFLRMSLSLLGGFFFSFLSLLFLTFGWNFTEAFFTLLSLFFVLSLLRSSFFHVLRLLRFGPLKSPPASPFFSQILASFSFLGSSGVNFRKHGTSCKFGPFGLPCNHSGLFSSGDSLPSFLTQLPFFSPLLSFLFNVDTSAPRFNLPPCPPTFPLSDSISAPPLMVCVCCAPLPWSPEGVYERCGVVPFPRSLFYQAVISQLRLRSLAPCFSPWIQRPFPPYPQASLLFP